MSRSELLKVLATVKPALADKDYVPIFQHVVFDGNNATTYNDRVAISIKHETDFEGALPGKLLQNLLSTGSSEELSIEQKDAVLKFTCGDFDFDLPYMDPKESIYVQPDVPPAEFFCDDSFVTGIKLCLVSVDSNSPMPELSSIHFFPKDGYLYATNGPTVSEYDIGKTSDHNERVYLSYEFCDSLLTYIDQQGQSEFTLKIYPDAVVASFENGHVYGKQPVIEDPLDFSQAISDVLDEKELDFVGKPEGLFDAIRRANLICPDGGHTTTIEVDDGVAHLHTASGIGEVDDRLPIDGHPRVSTTVAPALIGRAQDVCCNLFILDKVTVLADEDGYTYFVSNNA